jgi:hypothetical protein
VVAPVPGAGCPLGVLCATDREGGGPFGDDDLALLQILALQVGQLLAAWPADAEAAAQPCGAAESEATQPFDAEAVGGYPPASDDAELARMICEAMTVEVEPERLIDAALRPVARILPAAPVSLYLTDPRSGDLVLEGQCEGDSAGDRLRLPPNRGLSATVLQTGRLVATDHPETDPRFEPGVDTPESGAAGPLVCVPVQLRGKVLGVMRAFPTDGAGASARTGEVLAAALSAAVRNVLLYRSLLESVDDVARARREARGRT